MSTSDSGKVQRSRRVKVVRTESGRSRAHAGPSRFARAGLLGLKIVIPLVLLIGVAFGILYVRLLNGPIALKSLAGSIERAIAAELPQFKVRIEDAYVLLTDDRGIEFRLTNLRFSDSSDRPVAVAPRAALSLSLRALAIGQIAPERIVLIEPRLRLHYDADGRVSLIFPDGHGGNVQESLRRSVMDLPDLPAGSASGAQPGMDVGKIITDVRSSLGQTGQVASYLEGIGLRNAALLLDHDGRRSVWQVQSANFGILREGGRGVLTGNASVLTRESAWSVAFRGEDEAAADRLSLRVRLQDFVPQSVAPLVPELGPVAMLTTPVSGEIKMTVGRTGSILASEAKLALKEGTLAIPGTAAFGLDSGDISITYAGNGGGIKVQSLTARWGPSHLSLKGEAWPVGKAQGEVWRFAFGLVDGTLAAPDFGVQPMAVEHFGIKGEVEPDNAVVRVQELGLRTAGAQATLSGHMDFKAGEMVQNFSGGISKMDVGTVKSLWPRAINRDLRKWLGEQVLGGQLKNGAFKYATRLRPTDGRGGYVLVGRTIAATLEAENLKIEPEPGSVPVVAPRALIRLDNDALEVAFPEATVLLPSGATMALRQGALNSSEVWSPTGKGLLSFRLSGSLGAGLELIEQDAFGVGKVLGPEAAKFKGTMQSSFELTLPLGEAVDREDLKVRGEGKISDGEAPGVFGKHGAQGGAINFWISERTAEAKGSFLLAGVPIGVEWRRTFGAENYDQPPIRLSANLDEADRLKLGIDAGGVLRGEASVEMLVSPRKDAKPETKVAADLTKSEIVFKSLAWRKAPGIAASVAFDVEDTNGELALRNFRISGPDLNVNGEVNFNQKRGVYAFNFPTFALNLVSSLEVQGRLGNKGVWSLRVKGRSFDGRDFFRSLFTVGDDEAGGKKVKEADLDLKAEIGNVIGFDDISIRNVDLSLSRRGGLMQSVQSVGIVDSGGNAPGQPLVVSVTNTGKRRMVATSDDAGQVFRMVGFYPNMQRGRMQLTVDLDGRGPAEKTGQLYVRNFNVLGDEVVGEVLQAPDASGKRKKVQVREVLEFDWMRVPFSVGHGQFVMHGADLRGPLLGVTLKGKADYRTRTVNLGGVYVPLQGLNAMFADIPLLGQILSGPNGEGVLGVTFAIQGPMSSPQVLVNPLSMVAPGIFREMFQMTNPAPRVTPGDLAPAGSSKSKRKSYTPKSSAAPPVQTGSGRAQVDKDGGWVSKPQSD